MHLNKVECAKKGVNNDVSILLLMEDALKLAQTSGRGGAHRIVSILLLMEDALKPAHYETGHTHVYAFQSFF